MITQSIVNSHRSGPSYVPEMISMVMQKFNYLRFSRVISLAQTYPDRDYKFILFEYTNSGIDKPVAKIERIPHTTVAIHDVVSSPQFIERMKELFVLNNKMVFYNRRMFVYSNDMSIPSEQRQLVILIKRGAFVPRAALEQYEDDELPALIPMTPIRCPGMDYLD
jgi:hypothetical protein